MRIPFLGTALQRSMEYTADNHGYAFRPEGARRAIGVLSAGKHLLRSVDFDAMADRANSERGFFPWLANMLSCIRCTPGARRRCATVPSQVRCSFAKQLLPTLPPAGDTYQNGAWAR
jgi:hypothetical protein